MLMQCRVYTVAQFLAVQKHRLWDFIYNQTTGIRNWINRIWHYLSVTKLFNMTKIATLNTDKCEPVKILHVALMANEEPSTNNLYSGIVHVPLLCPDDW